MRKLPSLNALKTFEACARHCSFTLAAEELLVTQSAVSRQVAGLEDYLGVKLFLRQPRRIELTRQGKTLLPTLTEVFDRLASATSEVQQSARDLRVKLPPTFAIRWLIPRLRQFQDDNPDVEVLLNTGWNPVNFIKEDFDAAIVCASDLERYDQTVEANLIVQEHVTPICSPMLLEGGPPLREPTDLLHFTLLHGSDLIDVWQSWFESIGEDHPRPCRAQVFDLMDTAIHAAIRGFGVALAPREFVMDEVEIGQLVMPFPEISPAISAYYLVNPKRSSVRETVNRFRGWLVDLARAEWGEAPRPEVPLEPRLFDPDHQAPGVAT